MKFNRIQQLNKKSNKLSSGDLQYLELIKTGQEKISLDRFVESFPLIGEILLVIAPFFKIFFGLPGRIMIDAFMATIRYLIDRKEKNI